MEALYAKLYDKYTTLKTRKFSELDEINREQEEKFLNFVKASEVLTEHLRSENQNLRNENTEIRSTRDEERLELQKRLLEEELKNKALSYQVEKLKELISEGVPPHNHKDQSGTKRKTPESPQVTTRSVRKRTRQSDDSMVETDTVSPTRSSRRHSRQLTEDIVVSPTRSSRRRSRQLTEDIVVSPHISIPRESTTETLLVSQPQCCGSSNSARCPFQALGEHLIGMKLSTNNEGERDCIVATHPSSGLSFTLTWVNNSTGEEEEDELLYKVESLGTFQRVVPEWMRDVIKFSTSMIPVFFERVSRVIKPRD